MPEFKVKVKWGKEMFQDVVVNTEEEPMVFKAQLFALTGVQPERMKVMLKGAILSDSSWEKMALRDGAMVLMMGTKDEDMPVQNVEKTKFIEDMDEKELNKAMEMPAGLQNLGNTCYMNATIQCLKVVPELRTALSRFEGNVSLSTSEQAKSESITAALRDLYKTMDRGATVPPIIMLQVLHNAFPAFAERGEQGGFQQQDADECWMSMLNMLQRATKAIDNESFSNAVEQFFGVHFETVTTCTEAGAEPPTTKIEKQLQMSCFIIDKDVKYLFTGLKSKVQETISKHSPVLDRNADYIKTMVVTRLPSYLTIQMRRFQYKQKEDGGINAKVLKDVKFPVMLDMFDMCSKELQEKLVPMRTKFKEYEDWLVESSHKVHGKGKSEAIQEEKLSQDLPDDEVEEWWFPGDRGSNSSGYYRLQAVLTHKGRTSNSGHYVGWVRQKGDTWLMCDDEDVSPVHEEDVLKLSGGGDWHTAYLLLYAPRKLPKNRGSATPAAAVEGENMES